MAQVEQRTGKVDYWKTSDQKQRWLATALLDIEPRLRRVKGDRVLPQLRVALQQTIAKECQRSAIPSPLSETRKCHPGLTELLASHGFPRMAIPRMVSPGRLPWTDDEGVRTRAGGRLRRRRSRGGPVSPGSKYDRCAGRRGRSEEVHGQPGALVDDAEGAIQMFMDHHPGLRVTATLGAGEELDQVFLEADRCASSGRRESPSWGTGQSSRRRR